MRGGKVYDGYPAEKGEWEAERYMEENRTCHAACYYAGGHERKEDGASGERVADRIAEQAGQGLKPLICKETDRKNRRIGAQIPESGISGSTD